MAQVIEAIYAHGVLTPRDELALRESQRVRLIIEPIDDDTYYDYDSTGSPESYRTLQCAAP
jgi:predicted DNA-binding antitoxin AbrB/MazE fold protein